MASDMFSHFTGLDQLIQVIYQGVSKFVVLSGVANNQWRLHVGLMGRQGRWWRSIWEAEDIQQVIVRAGIHLNLHDFARDAHCSCLCKSLIQDVMASEKVIESFANDLVETFVQGDLCIGDWTPLPGANINLTFGPTSKKPLQIPLTELTGVEAAAYATSVFFEIGLQAQSRKCHLHPTAFPTFNLPSSLLTSTSAPSAASAAVPAPASPRIATPTPVKTKPSTPPAATPTRKDEGLREGSPGRTAVKRAHEEIKSLKAEVDRQKVQQPRVKTGTPERKAVPVPPRPLKGASLANPSKKARRYEEIEFESD
ncbi:hypothetical protein AX16_010656 [Volvariella volvacea WC 439]|nr:hypothetical protein AX16_010656 [Volvariella volvacea WC 439]